MVSRPIPQLGFRKKVDSLTRKTRLRATIQLRLVGYDVPNTLSTFASIFSLRTSFVQANGNTRRAYPIGRATNMYNMAAGQDVDTAILDYTAQEFACDRYYP
jgi:hypothetical protein